MGDKQEKGKEKSATHSTDGRRDVCGGGIRTPTTLVATSTFCYVGLPFSERDILPADGENIDEREEDEEEAVIATPELNAGGGFVLSEEAIAMFARGEARRVQERHQRLQQQQEEALAEERAAALQAERLEAEAQRLYGQQGLLRVRAMEESLERDFQQQCARTKPTLWPNMPLKL
ncbi:hypothetical protein QOT17_001180 [Balamuthia mandrillaris]